jgi:hypothetical protein
MSDPGKHRARDQWGPQEVIALVVIIGAFALAVIALVWGKPNATIPAWVAALVAGIGLYYYKANGKEGS